MATIQLVTPNKTTTKTITGEKALSMLDGFAEQMGYNDPDGDRKLENETKEEFFHRVLLLWTVNQAARGSEELAKQAALQAIVPSFNKEDLA